MRLAGGSLSVGHQGRGYKSLNVTARKTLGLFANVRPSVSYHPFVKTHHPAMDVVVVRENEEDTYAGIEHRQTREEPFSAGRWHWNGSYGRRNPQ